LFKIKAFLKNTHSHVVNISESRTSLTGALFFGNNAEFGQNGILGQAPSAMSTLECRTRVIPAQAGI